METVKDEIVKGKPKILLNWVAPERLFIPRRKSWFAGLAVLTLGFFIFLLLVSEWSLAVFFLVFGLFILILSLVEPEMAEYQILNSGLKTGKKVYEWKNLEAFWLAVKSGKNTLVLKTKLYFPDHLDILLGEQDPFEIETVLSDFLPYREMQKADFFDFLDGIISGVSKRLPLQEVRAGRAAALSESTVDKPGEAETQTSEKIKIPPSPAEASKKKT